jgi:hypothetical protein
MWCILIVLAGLIAYGSRAGSGGVNVYGSLP